MWTEGTFALGGTLYGRQIGLNTPKILIWSERIRPDHRSIVRRLVRHKEHVCKITSTGVYYSTTVSLLLRDAVLARYICRRRVSDGHKPVLH